MKTPFLFLLVVIFVKEITCITNHVFIIGIDGLGGELYFPNAKTPVLNSLMLNGTSTFIMQDVITTSSSQNWMSMIAGAGPDQHGVYDNGWERGDSEPTPTIFAVLREQKPDSTIIIYHHWEGFGRLVEPGIPDVIETYGTEDKTMDAAIKYLLSGKPLPDLMFIHLDHVDGAGHSRGWGSNSYNEAITKADSLIGNLLEAIEKAGIINESAILVSSDHGGINQGHGDDIKECRDIPFIVHGKGIKKNGSIRRELRIFDIGVTVNELMGLKAPNSWIGRPVYECFEDYLPAPVPQQKLKIKFVSEYEFLYDTSGTRSRESVSIWRPIPPSGYVIAGHVAVPGTSKPNFSSPVLYYDPEILRNPTGMEEMWNDRGSGGDFDVSIWSPTPPFGFTCLGNIAVNYYGKEPPRESVYCINGNYLVKDDTPTLIWEDSGSGADWDASFWGTTGTLLNDEETCNKLSSGIDLRTFFVRRDHRGPGYNKQHWLNPEKLVIEETKKLNCSHPLFK